MKHCLEQTVWSAVI